MRIRNCVILLLLVLFGCSSVELASKNADSKAKLFKNVSNKVVIYLVQNGGQGTHRVNFLVFVDGKICAGLSGHTYQRIEVDAGTHTLLATSPENQKVLTINTREGEVVFVGLKSMGGWTQMRVSDFSRLSEDEGKRAVEDAVLAAEIRS